MKTKRVTVSILAVLCFVAFVGCSVYFAVQKKWLLSIVCAMPGLVVAFGAIWALTAQALPSDRQRANTSFTLWEAVGHSVMAAMIVAALVGSVITGEWVWACFAFASLLTSIGFISARIRRGEKLSLRDVVDALF